MIEAIRADVAALASITRSSARPGELRAAEWVARRLRELGAGDVALESYRYQHSYALAHGLHALAGLAAAARGGLPGAAISAATLGSLELEASGRRQWLRRLLPASPGANVVARVPARGRLRARLVLVAHHDAANTGVVWSPALVAAGAGRHLRRRRVDAFMAPTAAALVAAAVGSLGRESALGRALRAAAAALLGTQAVAMLDVGRSATVPGASDNATGVATMLALAGSLIAAPLDDVELLIASVGSEEAGMGGMAAFLKRHGEELRELPAFVVGLDTLGAGTPIVLSGEGPILEHRYRERDLAVVDEGAAIAGLSPPQRWRIGGWTDPILAVFAGIPAVSLLSMGPGYFPHYHHPTDTPEHVDWDSVARCAALAGGTVGAYARRVRDGRL